MRTYWRTVLGISLTVAVVTEILVILLQGLVLNDTSTAALDDPSATARRTDPRPGRGHAQLQRRLR